MSAHARTEERRSTTRIAVNSVLLYRAVGMDSFKPCTALTISTQALEIVSERSIPVETIVAIAVKSDGSLDQFNRVYGKVTKRQQREGEWMHIVMASSGRPWSSMFLYDVMSATYEFARTVVAYEGPAREKICAELECVGNNVSKWGRCA